MRVAVVPARWGSKYAKIRKKHGWEHGEAQITFPLDIPDVQVLQTSMGEHAEIIITIESTKKGTACCKCGRWITKPHGQDKWVRIRYLPAFGRATYLRYRPRRYQCQDCEGHPTITQSLEWHDSKSPHSFAYDNYILLQLVNSTVEDVNLKERLSYASVMGTLERRTDASFTIPVDEGDLSLGTWQGIYVFEHRARPHRRKVLLRVLSVE